MPRKSTTHLDPRTDIELANGRPLMVAVPKMFLRKAAEECGSQDDLAELLSTEAKPISRRTVNEWICGRRTMGNLDVIHAAHVLDVSPLAVLDLCSPYESEAPHAEEIRAQIAEWVQGWLVELSFETDPRFGSESATEDDIRETYESYREHLISIPGDYRDLRRLATDAVLYYAEKCDPQGLSDFTRCIVDAGRRHAGKADQGEERRPAK